MKKNFIIASLVMLAACNSNQSAKTDAMKFTTDTTVQGTNTAPNINSPYPIMYSSQFVIGDPKNAEDILTLWKDWDNGKLGAHKDMFADSVELHFANGSMMHASRDSTLAGAQSVRNTLASSVSSVDAIIPAKSIDKNENWALIWGKEVDTDKKGKVDSFYLQETWRFNKDGKVDLLYQFKAAGAPPKK